MPGQLGFCRQMTKIEEQERQSRRTESGRGWQLLGGLGTNDHGCRIDSSLLKETGIVPDFPEFQGTAERLVRQASLWSVMYGALRW